MSNNEVNERISKLTLPKDIADLMDCYIYIDWARKSIHDDRYKMIRVMPNTLSESEVEKLWLERFGYDIPDDSSYGQHAETTPAEPGVYDGEMKFTDAEAKHVLKVSTNSDFTMDMAYLLFDHLKWRPLQRVPFSNHGWELLINQEPKVGWGYVRLMCDVLGYDDDEFDEHLDKKIDEYHVYYKKYICPWRKNG